MYTIGKNKKIQSLQFMNKFVQNTLDLIVLFMNIRQIKIRIKKKIFMY